jgi:hypothetical protein
LIVASMVFIPSAGKAQAHGMDAQAFIRPGGKVQIESWFSDGTAARGARVQVFHGNELLTEGKLNQKGVFIFTIAKPEALRVVVSAAGGHRKELTIAVDELATARAAITPLPAEEEGNAAALQQAVPLAAHTSELPAKEILTGIGFILSVVAFWMSVRNARRLNALRQK